MDEVSLSQNEFKALASKSRTNILKILQERNFTLSELATKTNMTAPTVKQHTSILVETGLIELKDEGRKWKYYALTKKGKQILDSKENKTNIFIVLSSVGIVALLGLAIVFSGNFLPTSLEASTSMDSLGDRTSITAAPKNNEELPKIVAGGDTEIAEDTAMAEFRCIPAYPIETISYDENLDTKGYPENCFSALDKESCEGIDVFSTETGQFGESDGIPECEWTMAKFGE